MFRRCSPGWKGKRYPFSEGNRKGRHGGRSYIAGHTAALAGVGWVEGNRQEAKLRHFLCVQAGGLLLYRTERTADGNSGQLALCAFRLYISAASVMP